MLTALDRALGGTPWRENPYFAALRRQEFARDDFLETQIQFYFAVHFFSRPMAALAGKIPTPELRVAVLQNAWEEHGEGNVHLSHGATFRELLRRLGGFGPEDLERRALWPEVRGFNTALVGACVLDEYLVGCATMGVIERMFSEISGWIGGAIVANGWLGPEALIHYDLHERLDVKHAEDFLDVLRPAWDGEASNRYFIEQGFLMGATLFNGLYEGLYRARGRRSFRDVRGPHTRG